MAYYNARFISQAIERVSDKVVFHPSVCGVRGPDTVVRESMICEDCGALVYAAFVDNHVKWHFEIERAAAAEAIKTLSQIVKSIERT